MLSQTLSPNAPPFRIARGLNQTQPLRITADLGRVKCRLQIFQNLVVADARDLGGAFENGGGGDALVLAAGEEAGVEGGGDGGGGDGLGRSLLEGPTERAPAKRAVLAADG